MVKKLIFIIFLFFSLGTHANEGLINKIITCHKTTEDSPIVVLWGIKFLPKGLAEFYVFGSELQGTGREILMIGSWMFNIVSAEWVIRKIYFNRSAV